MAWRYVSVCVALVSTHPSEHMYCQMEEKKNKKQNVASLCAALCCPERIPHAWGFVCICWGLCGPQWVLLVHCRPGVSPLCVSASPELCRLFDLRKGCEWVSGDGAVFSACQNNRQTHSAITNRHRIVYWLIFIDILLTVGLNLYCRSSCHLFIVCSLISATIIY